MNDEFDVEFDVEPEDIDKWVQVFSALEKGGGIQFQEAMEVFGEAVDDYLEEIVEGEDFGPESFNLIGWQKTGCHIEAQFEYIDIDFSEILEKLFSLCPVQNLTVIADWE